MTLNANQRRSLSGELRHLERNLLDLRQRLTVSHQGILIDRRALEPAAWAALEPLFEQMLQEIRVLADHFGLERRDENAQGVLQAEMAGVWAGLLDSLSPKLGRFGEVDPGLAHTLDPHLLTLIALADQIIRQAAIDSGQPPA